MNNEVQYTEDVISMSHRSQYADDDRVNLGWCITGVDGVVCGFKLILTEP